MATVARMHWLMAYFHGFDLYTNHNNLIYIFDPTFVVVYVSESTLQKVLRRTVRLSGYSYTCICISVTDNVWTDIIGRWSAPLQTTCRLVHIPPLPSS